MAVDKLVDSTQLNADLTSVANAIRTKGGTSGQLAFPNGFVSAVQAIPTGTTPTGTKQISITQNGTTTEDVAAYANAEITVNVSGGGGGIVLNLEDSSSATFKLALKGAIYTPIDEIVVDCANLTGSLFSPNYCQIKGTPKLTYKNTGNLTASTDFMRQCCTFREVDFGHFAPETLTRFLYQLNYGNNFPDGTSALPSSLLLYNLDLSNLTSGVVNPGSPQIPITFLFEGTLHIDMTFNSNMLTVESLVSIISCLEDLTGTGTTHTLTLGSANIAKLTSAQIAVATDKGWTVA